MAANDHSRGAVIGVDLGGTKLMAGLFNSSDDLVAKEYVLVSSLSAEDLLETMAGVVRTLAKSSPEPVSAVGYGLPATIDQRTGVAVVAANLPIKDLAIRDELARRTGFPAFIDNDGNVAALAEQRKGAGAGSVKDLLMVTLGTGFGGGIVIDGHIFSGAMGAGAELGHMSIDRNGPACVAPNCPGIGCIETFCSGSALARDLRSFIERHPESPLAASVREGAPAKGELVVQHAGEGDPDAIGLLKRMGENLGIALANFTNIFNPEMICLGGGLLAASTWVLPVATEIVRERSLPPGNEFVHIVPAVFGPDAGTVGAGILARDGIRRSGRVVVGSEVAAGR
jgi:glucokinase